MKARKLVIIGNGMAGNRLAETLAVREAGWQVTIIGDEPVPHYNRIMLSPLLAGETTQAAITAHDEAWYRERGIRLRLGAPVTGIDRIRRRVSCDGESIPYDALVLATGSRPAIPDLPGSTLDGVMGFRELADVQALQAARRHGEDVAVIGAGLLGIEAAVGLAAQGFRVRLLHRQAVLMNRQLDAAASSLLEHALRARGIAVHAGVRIEALFGNTRVESVVLGDGSTLPASTVVFATGIRPNTALAAAAGLDVAQGILVDERLTSSDSRIFALGECCEIAGNTFGLLAPIWQQVEVLADVLCGSARAAFAEQALATRLKVSGLDVHSMGEFDAADAEALLYRDAAHGTYRKLLLRDNRVVGALLVGDVSDSQWYADLLQRHTDISAWRQTLLFGRALCADTGPLAPATAQAA